MTALVFHIILDPIFMVSDMNEISMFDGILGQGLK